MENGENVSRVGQKATSCVEKVGNWRGKKIHLRKSVECYGDGNVKVLRRSGLLSREQTVEPREAPPSAADVLLDPQ